MKKLKNIFKSDTHSASYTGDPLMRDFVTFNLIFSYTEPCKRAEPLAVDHLSKDSIIALYDYTGETADELSFTESEILTVLLKDPGGWWEAQNSNGNRGWVPANYFDATYKY